MSKVGEAIYALLSADPGVSNLAETRIFPNRSLDKITNPAIMYQVLGNDPSDTKDGVSNLDQVMVQITIVAKDYSTVTQLSELVRLKLDRFKGLAGNVNIQSVQFLNSMDQFDEEGRLPIEISDYKFRVIR